jgi:hypothetical protein
MDGALLDDGVAALLLVLAVLDCVVAVTLVRLAWRKPHINALTERAFRSAIVAIVASVFAYLALDDHRVHLLRDSAWHLLATLAVVVLSIPAALWLWPYWRSRLGADEGER